MKWFIVVLTITILSCIVFLPQTSFATLTIRHDVYNTTDFGNGTHVLLTGLPPRLADGAGHYQKDYYFYNNTGKSYTVATGFGTYVFVKNACGLKFFPPSQNPSIPSINSFTYSIRHSSGGAFVKDVFPKSCLSSSVIDTGKHLQINGTRTNANATFVVSYTIDAGHPLKATYYLFPKLNNMLWRITESQADIPNIIKTINATYHEDNRYDPQNSTTTIITNSIRNGGHVISFIDSTGQPIVYDYQTAILSLKQVGINLNVTSGRTQLFNDYQTDTAISNTTSFVIDPTWGYTTGNYIHDVSTPSLSNSCNNGPGSIDSVQDILTPASGVSVGCHGLTYRWNISSIPVGSSIQSATIKYDITGASNAANCKFVIESTDPNTIFGTQRLTRLVSGATYIANDADCTTVANGKTISLPATTQIQNNLPLGWFAVGFTFNSFVKGVAQQGATTVANFQLQITYTVPQQITIHALQKNGTTAIFPGAVTDTNSTTNAVLSTNSTGYAGPFRGTPGVLQNYTIKDLASNFVVNKTYNYNPLVNATIASNTNAFTVNCAFNGAGNDIVLELNDTNGHRISSFSTPVCASNNTITSTIHFTANGQNGNTYSSSLWAKILNATAFGVNPNFMYINGTQYATQYNTTTKIITSNSFTVGTGLQSNTYLFSMRLNMPNTASAPTLSTAPTGDAKITLTWTVPASDGGSPINGYKIIRNSTTLVSNTTNTLTTYQDTGLKAYHKQSYQVAALTIAGTGALSNVASNYTYIPTLAQASLNYTIVGNMIGVSPSIKINNANPNPTVTQIQFYNKTTLLQTTTPNTIALNNTKNFYPIFYHGLLGSIANSNYTVKITVTNATGPAKVFTSNATGLVNKSYTPAYFTAVDPTQGSVNYTIARTPDQKLVVLQFNRDKNAALWQSECLFQTGTQAGASPPTGTWINRTQIGYYKAGYSDPTTANNIYVSCYNGGLLFTTTSYSNATLLAGINYFNTTFSGFIGVPVGVFFLACIAGLATGRTAPTITVILIASAAIMAAMGFFVIGQAVWGLCLIGGAACLFGGKKFL